MNAHGRRLEAQVNLRTAALAKRGRSNKSKWVWDYALRKAAREFVAAEKAEIEEGN